MSFLPAKAIDRMVRFGLGPQHETNGVDLTQHAEIAYAEGVHGYLPLRPA